MSLIDRQGHHSSREPIITKQWTPCFVASEGFWATKYMCNPFNNFCKGVFRHFPWNTDCLHAFLAPSLDTWLSIREIKGDTTTTTADMDVCDELQKRSKLSEQNDNSWYTRDFPNPVGTLMNTSSPFGGYYNPERNGMEWLCLLKKYRTHGTEQSRNSRLASMALIMACSLSITRGYFTLRMANVVYRKAFNSCQLFGIYAFAAHAT